MANINNPKPGGAPELALIIEGKKYEWLEQYILGRQLRKLAGLPADAELYLALPHPWKDEPVSDDAQVDIARPEIEHFYVKRELRYTLNEVQYESDRQYIEGKQLRRQGNIPKEQEIFLAIAKPWDDEHILDDTWVDLARPGIEHFYSREIIYVLIINAQEDRWRQKAIAYDEVVKLAFPKDKPEPNRIYTVTFKRGPIQNPEGSMVKGDTLFVKDKMIFNVTPTDKS